ncbi:allophanate hydrolase, partial [Campylobacter coli]|nr:allophanate hydrolase [Campylobacter coli]
MYLFIGFYRFVGTAEFEAKLNNKKIQTCKVY